MIYLLYQYDDKYRDTLITGKIIDANYYDGYSKYIIRVNRYKVLLYDYNDYHLKVGVIVKIEGNIKDIDTVHVPNDFDYYKYLKNNHCFYALSITKADIIKNSICLGSLRSYLISYFDKNYSTESASFLKALLVGYSSSLDSDFYNSLKDNGILHLFAISGLHVSFFTTLLKQGLEKIHLKEKIINYLIFIFLITYIVITNFSASILRAALMYFFNYWNQKKNLSLSSSDILSITFIMLIIINPLFAFNNGFILSFLVSFVIIIVSPLISNYKNITQIFIISISSIIITLPIIININYEINILAPFINILFISLITLVMLPSSIIMVILPSLDYLFKYLVIGFSNISILISKYLYIAYKAPHFTPIMVIIYYLILLIIVNLKKKKAKIKMAFVFLIYLLCLSNINLIKPFGETYFLDLYYGEATVIFSPFKNSVVIIDTGDGTSNALTNFLKSKGVKQIECIIITHHHSDHYGELENLKDEFIIKKIISSNSDNWQYGNNLEKVKRGDIINLDRFSLDVLNPINNSEDINDNSLVLYGRINNINILLMGDASESVENEIIPLLKNKQIDLLKVGHHGSSSATSVSFLDETNIDVAIIMAGRVKKFGFPHKEVINNLSSFHITTFSTSSSKTIWVRSFGSRYNFYSLA